MLKKITIISLLIFSSLALAGFGFSPARSPAFSPATTPSNPLGVGMVAAQTPMTWDDGTAMTWDDGTPMRWDGS